MGGSRDRGRRSKLLRVKYPGGHRSVPPRDGRSYVDVFELLVIKLVVGMGVLVMYGLNVGRRPVVYLPCLVVKALTLGFVSPPSSWGPPSPPSSWGPPRPSSSPPPRPSSLSPPPSPSPLYGRRHRVQGRRYDGGLQYL